MKILIATALSLEFDAVKAHLKNTRPETHPATGTRYEKGEYIVGGLDCPVLLFETGAGNVRAAEETSRALEYFKPDYSFFVGVAGGIKDVDLGDVVASTKVIGYEMGKDEDPEFKPRLDTIPASYELEQLAKEIKRRNNWHKGLTDSGREINSFVQPIAAGEKVVASDKAVAYKYLRTFCSDAVAVAMEGNGFMIAVRAQHAKGIEIRGISDMIVDKEVAEAGGSQPRAAEYAVAFMFAMISQLGADQQNAEDITGEALRKLALSEILKRYPQGPEQNDIWRRAGGGVSIFTNNASRKSQWYNALEQLALGGGGGKITWKTLVDTIREEFTEFLR